jgi:TolB-like protein/tetratricopeptide (TPR) repeat protein/predicted Ser/Thr protein kinase
MSVNAAIQPPDDILPSMIGTALGRYRILEPLGHGGMGRIFLAEDPALGRRLAIKVLPENVSDPLRKERLLKEARAASALNHPNIVTVLDVGEADGALFVAMELIEGETLRQWATAGRSPTLILHVVRQAARALDLAHAAGIVHRDLKPENLMVRSDGLLKVLDFGLARSVTPEEFGHTATAPGTVLGTTPYMSPEQVLGHPAGPPSDLFSLGIILYELLTARHPFAASTAVDTMHRILHETPEPPSRVTPALSPAFDLVLARALAKEPDRRHSSARDLDLDLEQLERSIAPGAAHGGRGSSGGPKTVAVLPFKNIGGDPELSYLGVGLADAVITLLATSPDVIVRSTGSILRYQDQPVDPRRVGEDLGASAVLDASFQRIGGRFRATARLMETTTGRALWAGKVDVRIDDLFEVQDQVAQGIAEGLTPRLSGRPETTTSEFVPNPQAYLHFMRGSNSARVFTESSLRDAISEFQLATELEPRYAGAWVSLGRAYLSMVDGGFQADPAWYEKAEAALARAREIDPAAPHLFYALGCVHLVRGRKRESYRELTRALERTPNSADLHHYFSYLFRLSDLLDEAFEASRRAWELDPNVIWSYAGLARIETLRRGADEGIAWLNKARERLGASSRLDYHELRSLALNGRFAEMKDLAGRLRAYRNTGDAGYWEFGPLIWLLAGYPEEAARIEASARSYSEIDMDGAEEFAAYCAHRGAKDDAFRYLARAAELGNDSLTIYEKSPIFEPLRDDPRWMPFLEGVRERVSAYRREFSWPPRA